MQNGGQCRHDRKDKLHHVFGSTRNGYAIYTLENILKANPHPALEVTGFSPIRINRVGLVTNDHFEVSGWMSDQRLNVQGESEVLPMVLERTQEAKLDMQVFFGFEPWRALPRGNHRFRIVRALHRWWFWRNVGFQINSSIRTIFARLPVEEVKWLQEEVLQPYDERQS